MDGLDLFYKQSNIITVFVIKNVTQSWVQRQEKKGDKEIKIFFIICCSILLHVKRYMNERMSLKNKYVLLLRDLISKVEKS